MCQLTLTSLNKPERINFLEYLLKRWRYYLSRWFLLSTQLLEKALAMGRARTKEQKKKHQKSKAEKPLSLLKELLGTSDKKDKKDRKDKKDKKDKKD